MDTLGGGAAFDQRFALGDRVGTGAFGEVFRAVDRLTGAPVAVKRLHPHLADTLAVQRFDLEARLLARVASPHVVRYVAHGRDDAGRLLLAIEWLEGEDLAARQRAGAEPVAYAAAVEIARQAALGLAALHAAGIVHRDIKPSNFFLVRGAGDDAGAAVNVKLIDLGIARELDQAALTLDGARIGTPAYMSPEQATGDAPASAASDLFSLGVVLYELLARRRPYTGSDPYAVLAKIVMQPPPPLRVLAPDVPPTVVSVVERLLEKDPARRGDAASVAAELAACAGLLGPLGAVHGGGRGARRDDGGATASRSSVAPTVAVPPPALVASDELRVVTLVFAGFAPAPPGGEPEDPATRFAALVAAHGGQTHRTLGRRAVAAFGLLRSDGTDAARAARAALATRAALPTARLSIATCRVLARDGGVADDEFDRGAREVGRALEGVRLDAATARLLLAAHFDVAAADTPAPVLRGEGGVDGMGAGIDDGGERDVLGRATPTVGRERELGVLASTFDECCAEPAARVVVLLGAPGGGKSRVRREFVRRARAQRPDALVLGARAEPLAEGSPFALLAAALRTGAGVRPGEPPARFGAWLARAARVEAVPARVVAFLGELARVPGVAEAAAADEPPLRAALEAARADPILMGDAMRAAWEDWLALACASRPVLLALEDLHWGDLPTVRFVDAALRALRERPLMVLATARPEVHARFPGLWSAREPYEVRLAGLTRSACRALARAVLDDAALDDTALERLVARAEGNPFVLEELVRAAARGIGTAGGSAPGRPGGALASESQSTPGLPTDALPDTVLGIVQARLDALEPRARRVLRVASVFGDRFWRAGLRAVLGGASDETAGTSTVTDVLEHLAARELLVRQSDARFPHGEVAYVFRDALVRDAAYAMLPPADRERAHRRAGEWLERAGEADPLVLAAHFHRGGAPARARGFYRAAAEQALRGNAFADTIAHAAQALACDDAAAGAGVEPIERAAIELLRAEAHRWRGESEPAAERAVAAFELAPPGSAPWFRAVLELVTAFSRQGMHPRIAELMARIDGVTPVDLAAAGAAVSCASRGASHMVHAGRYDDANVLIARARALAATHPEAPAADLARIAYDGAVVAMCQGDSSRARTMCDEAAARLDALGDARSAAVARLNAGVLSIELGDYARAEADLRAARAETERMSLASAQAYVVMNLGHAVAAQGRVQEAAALEREALASAAAAQDRRLHGGTHLRLAALAYDAGELDEAARCASAAEADLGGFSPLAAAASAVLARVAVARGELAAAREHVDRAAVVLARVPHLEVYDGFVRLAIVEVCAACGDHAAARAALEQARARLTHRAALMAPAEREGLLGAVREHARLIALAAAPPSADA